MTKSLFMFQQFRTISSICIYCRNILRKKD